MTINSTSFGCLLAWLVVAIALGPPQGTNGTPVIHMVAHSHCDAGYRESFEGYWTSSVHDIIDSMLYALSHDQTKRFVWEEVSFLSTWWKQASDESRELMKKLHAAGQLEFIGGGWVMHDEANPSLFGILNQMYQGLSFLRDTFGARPSYEWHIDPFGHSLFMPELYAQLGYKAVVINRIPDAIKQSMRADKGLEFFWKYPNSKFNIFTHVLDTHYGTPKLLGLNVQSLVLELVPIVRKRLNWFQTDHLLLPFGGDFNFKIASLQFSIMDDIMQYINANSSVYNMTLRYSTLSEYFSAVMGSGADYVTRSNDFFPYIPCHPCGAQQCENLPCEPTNQSSAYWSGFFSSKPAQKLLVREQEAKLKSLEVLNALSPSTGEEVAMSLELGRNTSALLQHHDAITGTSYPPAFDDYNTRLDTAVRMNDRSIAGLKNSILCKQSPGLSLTSDSVALLTNIGEERTVAAVIHNPLPVQRSSYISIQLPSDFCAQVFDSNQTVLPSQQVSSVLYFPVNLPPWGMEVVFLSKKDCEKVKDELEKDSPLSGFTLSNGVLSLKFDANNHLDSWSMTHSNQEQAGSTKVTQETHPLLQTYYRYDEITAKSGSATDGTNVYTFDPERNPLEPTKLTPEVIPSSVTASGPLVWEVKQKINEFINTTIRLYSPIGKSNSPPSDVQLSSFAQWQTIVGPLPESPAMSITSQFLSTDLDTKSYHFTTYTNGFYPVAKQYNTSAPIQANTYPLVGRAIASSSPSGHTPNQTPNEGTDVLAVIVERPMALTGRNGSVEMMLHRRISKKEDPRGNDTTVMNDSILVGFLGEDVAPAVSARLMALFQTPPTVHFALLNGIPNDIKGVWSKICGGTFQWLPSNSGIPQGVEIIDVKLLKPTSSGARRVGLHVIYTDEHAPGPCTFDLTTLFKDFTTTSVVEATPDFLEKQTEDFDDRRHSDSRQDDDDIYGYRQRERNTVSHERNKGGRGFKQVNKGEFSVELYPLQLKTFILTLKLGRD